MRYCVHLTMPSNHLVFRDQDLTNGGKCGLERRATDVNLTDTVAFSFHERDQWRDVFPIGCPSAKKTQQIA